MAEVKWIKITTDMFDNRKIKHLRKLPDGNNIVLIWVMLLTMAGRCNANGMIFLTENIPYTAKMLADELDFEENTVVLALKSLEHFGMVITDGSYLTIAGWTDHQNIEGMDKIREQNRLRKRKQREALKELPEPMSRDSHVTVTQCHATEEEIEREEDKEVNKDNKNTCQQIVDLYHSICISFPSVRSLSDSRKKAIKARMRNYSLDDFRTVFENAESSSFLKGSNDRNWTATFDWLIKDANMAKVLEGNYEDKPGKSGGRKEIVPGWCASSHSNLGDAEMDAIRQLMNEDKSTIGNNADLAERAEKLKQSLQTG